MKLKSVHIKNYRNIEDSGKFSIGPLTCLVGKNEAGKTSVLTALEKFNSVKEDVTLDKDLDYPRKRLIKFQETGEPSGAVVTNWELSDADIKAIEDALVPGCIKLASNDVPILVTIESHYDDENAYSEFIDEQKVVNGLLKGANLDDSEESVIETCASTEELYKALGNISSPTEKHNNLRTRIEQYRDKLPHLCAIDVLKERVPKFLYFSNYDCMNGAVSYNELKRKLEANESLKAGEKIFYNFLGYAGVSMEDIEGLKTNEKLYASLESASSLVSEQVFKYWSQNKNLEIIFDIREGMPADPPPLNQGKILLARVKNNLHKMTVDFSERSAGFVWFFSFIVHFSQVKKEHDGDRLILWDEPGLSVHGKAQADLLQYIRKELLPNHQVLYTTHSPFMIPTDNWDAVKTVEDVVNIDQEGRQVSNGAKVSEESLKVTRDTMFPLQGALGYAITQSLFVGANVLLVEGPSDVHYLQVMSSTLREKEREGLSEKWTICPVGGIGNISPFMSLFGANGLCVAALIDYSKNDKNTLENLRKNSRLRGVHTCAEFTDKGEADVEDLFDSGMFVRMLNGSYNLREDDTISVEDISNAKMRIVQQVEELFKRFSPSVQENFFDHYRPAKWLAKHIKSLGEIPEPTLTRFEEVFKAFNKILKEAEN